MILEIKNELEITLSIKRISKNTCLDLVFLPSPVGRRGFFVDRNIKMTFLPWSKGGPKGPVKKDCPNCKELKSIYPEESICRTCIKSKLEHTMPLLERIQRSGNLPLLELDGRYIFSVADLDENAPDHHVRFVRAWNLYCDVDLSDKSKELCLEEMELAKKEFSTPLEFDTLWIKLLTHKASPQCQEIK